MVAREGGLRNWHERVNVGLGCGRRKRAIRKKDGYEMQFGRRRQPDPGWQCVTMLCGQPGVYDPDIILNGRSYSVRGGQ